MKGERSCNIFSLFSAGYFSFTLMKDYVGGGGGINYI